MTVAVVLSLGLAGCQNRAWLSAKSHYTACVRASADPASTHLHPVAVIDSSNDKDDVGGAIPHGTVRLEHATDLVLSDGRLGAGSGYAAATGAPDGEITVAKGPVTAPVTLAVLDSPTGGRLVAYVEVRVRATAPVSWRLENKLAIGTDGGDGGFVRGTAARVEAGDGEINDYVDAFYPHGNSASGNVCVLGMASSGQTDSVLFSTGYGDGGYPTFVGTDAHGDIASVVSFGFVLPWADSGLPGPAPQYDFSQ